ncbi:hypothetical protein Q3G72_033805 [Acer saccharum]|nr:hypothetical protein Q3G72_033805 [Acer saccharum]
MRPVSPLEKVGVFGNNTFTKPAFGYGNFLINEEISFEEGNNTLDVLSMNNYGPWFDVAGAGLYAVAMIGLKNGMNDLSLEEWTYRISFFAPEGKGPIALNLASMGKGQAWVNGESIGRYWSAHRSPSTGCTENGDYRGNYDPFK